MRTIRTAADILTLSEQGTIGLPTCLPISIIWTEPDD
jgi:hypothetical protein